MSICFHFHLERALCLKICSCLVIIDPCYNTVPLEWTLDCPQPEESHPEPASATGHPKLPQEVLPVGGFSWFPRHHLSAHAAKFFCLEVLCLSWLEGQPIIEYTTTVLSCLRNSGRLGRAWPGSFLSQLSRHRVLIPHPSPEKKLTAFENDPIFNGKYFLCFPIRSPAHFTQGNIWPLFS